MADVSLKEYIDTRTTSIEKNITDLRLYIQQNFDLNDRALKIAADDLNLRLKTMSDEHNSLNGRVKCLETTKAFSAGKMWMVMAIFAAVPTVLALIALFVG